MKTRLFVGLALLSIITISCVGCNEGGGSNTASAAVSAKNIVFRNSSKPSTASGDQVLKEGTVYAENVMLETTANAITSSNLQDALDNELAINLATLLPGTVWNIENKSTMAEIRAATGRISFGNGTFTMDSGYLHAGGISAFDYSTSNYFSGDGTYELLGNNVLFLSYNTEISSADNALSVIAKSKGRIVLLGVNRVSALTRIQ